ncbi:CCR4-NOT transcription complex subunit 3 isoform X1 [Zea mays]|uniref:Transcription regulator NOT2/NOT3/NOT5 family protein n=1 Tax=Zea mays TaxID=4577 RepID=A0A1D6KZA5_MAIZE|nr:CCR4-NOT transcription complex subunit 3 isoform X1 [Zea mays]ONM07713.1 transcription regulator NOT2/NOT3/NOT5 family protein [Zea mays]|eukprot:XP_020402447.1 CCR4-NOT transcription complex subunit 3 isoform X1 [Zea mays]
MGASRKLQGEIDRVLKKVQEGVDVFDSIWNKVYDTENANQKEKFEADLKKEIKKLQRYRDQIKTWIQSSEIKDKKVSASYEQALMDARKQIEREMERFKVCEKETKTKAFSKEGLGQQPKTDPKEKAKAETRDWLNNVVSDLESQIDNFEAEIEGLSIKKGKQRPPRLVHLEKSITRHKAHIKKLESILRLLDNDELSPEQVNDVKDFLDDYVERNQEDFDEFSDVEDLYSTLPMEKVEALEDMVSLAPSSLVKGVASVPTTAVSSTKSSIATSLTQPTVSTAPSQSTSQDQTEDTASQESNSESVPQTPPPKGGNSGPSIPAVPIAVSTGSAAISVLAETISSPVRPIVPTTVATILSSAIPRSAPENTSTVTSIPANLSITLKDDESMSFPPRRPSPAITEIGIGRGIARGTTSQALGTAPITIGPVPGNGSVSALPGINDLSKRNILNTDEKINSGGLSQQLVMPLGSKVQPQQVPRTNDAISSESANTNESPILGGRVFSPPVVSGVQWRPLGAAAFQNQSEISHFRGRPEISADHREKYIQRLQQVQQQGGSLLNVSHITGINQKQFPTQQPNPLLQQFNSQSSSISSQVNLGVQGTDAGHIKSEEEEQLLAEDGVESSATTGANKQTSEDDTKIPYSNPSAPAAESNQLPRDTDPSPGQPLQPGMSSSGVGVIGRRSVSDLGAIGDNLTGTSASSGHDQLYNLQMLEAAFHKLPQPKDSERAKTYIPRHPAVTPASYPQVQPSIVSHPSFWERIGSDTLATDMLFFAFYYQQNTYQQYMAARELKKQSWRFHRRYNTWFQRHVEPQVTTDEYERGSYVYFDFHVTEDGSGWCQRIKNDFTFEYNFLEDELSVQTN